MIQHRRISAPALGAWLVGIWLGASILADVAVTQNFQTVDRFLNNPGDRAVASEVNEIGISRERSILRRNAADENNWIFTNWERAELVLGAGLLAIVLMGERQSKLLPGAVAVLIIIVTVEHLLLTPRITELGRVVDGLSPSDPRYKTFWTLHSLYSGADILKILLIAAVGIKLIFKHRRDQDAVIKAALSRDYALANSRSENLAHGKR